MPDAHGNALRLCLVAMLALAAQAPAAWVHAQGPEEGVVLREGFDGQAGGWRLEPGWAVTGGALCGEGHTWAAYEAGSWPDYRLQFRLRLQRGTIHLNYRRSGPRRYFVGFRQDGLYLIKQTGEQEFSPELAGSDARQALEVWHQVEIAGQGGRLRVSVDGALLLDYHDPEPLLAGGIAFETLDDSAACIDDVVVYAPRPEPAAIPHARPAWVRTGGPLGGLGYDIRLRPDNPERMYVTDAYAGVHVSDDRGLTWTPANQGITARAGHSGDAIPVFCLTVDPHDHDVVWCGTQNTRGIFRSTDGGRTWVELDEGIAEIDGISFRGITVDPRSSDVVYAAAELSSWAWAGEERAGREFDLTAGVVYKTTDGGRHWQAVWRGENLARYILIDPHHPDTLYVSTGIFDREAANSDPVKGTPGGEGVLKSTDGGKTWMHANNGLGNLYVGTLFMHPADPQVLLAGTGNNQYFEGAGAYLTTDGGATWQQTLRDDIITAVEFCASQPDVAYAGSAASVYRSRDGGRTWERVAGGEGGWGPPGVRAGFPIDFQVDPGDPERIYANNYGGGNFLSTDGGRTWAVASQGYTGAEARDVAADPAAPARVYVAARSGIFVSADGGGNWLGLSSPPVNDMEWNAVAVDPADSAHLLAANNWCGCLAWSHDGGRSWHPVEARPGLQQGFRAIAFAPSDPAIVYAGTGAWNSAGSFGPELPAGGIYASRDGGHTFARANDSLSQDAHVAGLAVDPHDAGLVYAATTNHGILLSRDGGLSWATANQGLPRSPGALAVAVHPLEPGLVFAGLTQAGLYRSRDGGQTWQPVASGLNPEAAITDIAFDPAAPEVMYVADRFSGVYRSEDGGATWLAINSGLRTRAVNALAISGDGRHLYAVTEGEGAFRLDVAGTAPAPAALAELAQTGAPPSPVAQPAVPGEAPTALPVVASTPSAPGAPAADRRFPAAAALWIVGGVALAAIAVGLAAWHGRRRRP